MNTMLTLDQYNDSELAQYALDHSQDPLVKALGVRLLAAIDLAEEEVAEVRKDLEDARDEHADEIADFRNTLGRTEGERDGALDARDAVQARLDTALALIPSHTKHKGLLAIKAALEE